MKRLSILLALLVCAITNVVAQTPYVDGARVTADSITYADGEILKSDSVSYKVTNHGRYCYYLTNTENTLTGKNPIYLDGTSVSLDDLEYELSAIDAASIQQAINATFTPAELNVFSLQNAGIRLVLTKNNLGELLEVEFCIYNLPKSTTIIPVSKIALFEKNLKQHVRFFLSNFEKELKFSSSSFLKNWKRYAPELPLPRNPDAEMLPDSVQAYE